MLAIMPPSSSFETELPDEDAMRQFAGAIAPLLTPGDVVALVGDLGAGKTTFARGLIRQLAGDERLEVPSPTFTLLQTYELPRFPVVHVDLYRIQAADELTELGWPEFATDAVTLVEWPERAGALLPTDRLEIALELAPDLGADHRRIRVSAIGSASSQVHRYVALRRFLQDAGYDRAERVPVQGDASTRMYERMVLEGRSAILMNAPRRPDGPPIRDGRPYSAIAHLAEDVTPFVALARALRERGFSAPEIRDADLADGFLVLEDLGSQPVVAADPARAIEERYAAAVDALVALHRLTLPDTLPVAPGVTYKIPLYDVEALLVEVELLLDWYLPHQGREAPKELRTAFANLWRESVAGVGTAPATWVLRDFHSPNLLWLPEREGIARVGILDFQDALMGPAAYDVVSLLQDARVDVPSAMEDALFRHYIKARHAADRDFDMNEFIALYALLGAQRATKILGIFARLDRRDGKPQYLRHQPRVWRSLRRSLAHPSLGQLKAWYDAHVQPPQVS